MGYLCPKNTFTLLKHYMQTIYLSYFQLLAHQIPKVLTSFLNHKSFFTTQLLCIFFAQTLHTFDKSSPSKCKFSDLSLVVLKFTKFLLSFFKQKVNFSSKFGSFFSVIKHNSSVLFWLKHNILSKKVAY